MKLSQRYLFSVTTVLVLVTIASLTINTYFLNKFYLYEERESLKSVCDTLLEDSLHIDSLIPQLEHNNSVIITRVDYTDNNDLLNDRIKASLLDRGIALTKYWLWEEDHVAIDQGKKVSRLYPQPKLSYSIFVSYLLLDSTLINVVKIIPATGLTVELVNRLNIIVFSGALILSACILYVLTKRILRPLNEIGKAAQDISRGNFHTVDIHTKDELETLADHINVMSQSLANQQRALEDKNKAMEQLLSNVSHDIKTPVTLIKTYATGIQDGLDDGTFLTTITEQADRINTILVKLLDISKMEHQQPEIETVPLSQLTEEIVKQFAPLAESKNKKIVYEGAKDLIVYSNRQDIELILSNLMLNALLYSSGTTCTLQLREEKDYTTVLQISNLTQDLQQEDIEKLWQPFFRKDSSRSNNHNSSGLGLSLAKAAATRNGIELFAELKDSLITFTLKLP